jgi:hypothetical protein
MEIDLFGTAFSSPHSLGCFGIRVKGYAVVVGGHVCFVIIFCVITECCLNEVSGLIIE